MEPGESADVHILGLTHPFVFTCMNGQIYSSSASLPQEKYNVFVLW